MWSSAQLEVSLPGGVTLHGGPTQLRMAKGTMDEAQEPFMPMHRNDDEHIGSVWTYFIIFFFDWITFLFENT